MNRFSVALALAASLTAGCSGGAGNTSGQTMEMRVYDVPPE